MRLKYVSLDMLLINCEVPLTLSRSKSCTLTSKATRDSQGNVLAVAAVDNPTGATFAIIDANLYHSVVSSSTENDNKLLE